MMPFVEFGNYRLSLFPLILLIAFYSCVFYCSSRKRYDIGQFRALMRMILFCLLFAIISGKLLYAVTRHPYSLLEWKDYIFHGGFVFYGGLLGSIVGLFIFSRLKAFCFLDYLDIFLSVLPLGQAIGRLGCFLNGCCYGIPYSGLLSVPYPVNETTIPVFPTWFFESAFTLVLFLFFHLSEKITYRGLRSSIYMISYSIFRFVIEFFRGDSIRGYWYGLSTSQWISVVTMSFGVVVLIWSIKSKVINQSILVRSDRYAV